MHGDQLGGCTHSQSHQINMLRGPLDEPLLSDARRRRYSSWRKDVVSICIIGACAALLFVSTSSSQPTATMASSFVVLAKSDVPTSGSFVILPPCLHIMVGVALRGTGLLSATVAVVPALGSGAEGAAVALAATEGTAAEPTAAEGTAAESATTAAWQTTMGDVEAKSLSAHLQSLAARGQLLWALETGLRVTGRLAAQSAAYCAKQEEIGNATPGAAGAVANTTRAALAQIKRAVGELEGKAAEQLRAAADRNAAEELAAAEADEEETPWEETPGSAFINHHHKGDEVHLVMDGAWRWWCDHVPVKWCA